MSKRARQAGRRECWMIDDDLPAARPDRRAAGEPGTADAAAGPRRMASGDRVPAREEAAAEATP